MHAATSPTLPRPKLPPPGLRTATTFTDERPLRVGVLGCAKVLFKSWPAIHSAGHRITYIGCRDTERAAETAKEIIAKIEASATEPSGILLPRFGSYAEVIASPEVDLVYITIPVALRDPWVRACIAAGKHIVDEKPAAASAPQLLAWLDGCTDRRLLFMDGTMLTHSARMHAARDKAHALGPLKHIEATFSFLANDSFLTSDIRCRTDLEPHGALGDLGWYATRWILHLVDFAIPTQVSGAITAATPASSAHACGGAITAFSGSMAFSLPGYAAPVTASFSCSFHAAYQQAVRIFAKGGVVEVQGAINPTGEDRPHFVVRTASVDAATRRPVMSAEKVYSSPSEVDGSQQATEMWRSVGHSLVRLGVGEPLLMDAEQGKDWGRNAYITQLVLDKLLESATTATALRKE